jgi:ATP-dependent Clp protease ATP-binding subunit ClpB
MTSNMGALTIQERFVGAMNKEGEVSEDIVELTRNEVIEQLKQHLKPEFLNRIDEIVMFEPLSEKNILEIVDIQLGIVHKMLKQSGIELRVTDKAREWIAHIGYDVAYGARPVKRVIQREVINELSKRILAGKVDKSKPIVIDTSSDELSFSN